MDQLVNFIIRPPRADYSPKDDLLEEEFGLSRRYYRRKDLDVINGQGKKLKCSHYLPLIIPEGKSLPCVIYCHGNSGCRADASEVAIILLPSNITVFTLDFSGSGLSEGEHVTLGWNEKEDLKAVVNHLRSDGSVSFIGLWGRSMGAVTSLMYGAEDPSIAGMVLDSPFSNLVELMMELVDKYKYPLPKFTVKLAIQHMCKIIKKKANFDIMDLDTIEVTWLRMHFKFVVCCFYRWPSGALFGHAVDDDFIRPHHSERICDAYMGDKNIIKFEGDHNSPRPQFYFDSVTIFFHNVLHPPDDLPEDDQFLPEDYFNQGIGYRNPSFNNLLTGNGVVTTEDAIAQLRSRRLMSRVEVPSGTPTTEDSICDGPLSSVSSRANLTPMMEDADFLEYSLDSYAEIPCTAEDEQRMLTEAIMASLKDVKVESPEEKEQEDNRSNNVDTSSASPSCKTDMPTLPTSSTTSIPNSDIKDTVEDTTNDASTAPKPSSNADTSDGTRATLVVQRSRSGTIIDGLTQKLGFNFFKNNS